MNGPDHRLEAICVDADASVRTVMIAIGHGAIDIALIVDGDRRLIGTVTDGDVRRALLAGVGLEDRARPLANPDFAAVSEGADRAWVLDLMKSRHISAVPVLDEQGRVTGVHVLREVIGGGSRPEAAVVMAGGRGVRLRPLTDDTPKPMLRVAGRPILERLILHLVGNGVHEIMLAVNYRKEQIEQYFGDGQDFGCRIAYLREDDEAPLGTAGALRLVPTELLDRIPALLVMNGDLVTQFNVGAFLDHHHTTGAAATIGVDRHVYDVPFGVVTSSAGLLEDLSEKPRVTWKVNAGVYALSPHLVSDIPAGIEYPMTELLASLVRDGQRVGVRDLDSDWIDVGRPSELSSARGQL